ncbi:MAG: tetratricopeptide repeat protein, partial [Bacteroidales bacterium]|nr:tetratricopeptide repeat protein [Bacteroidales bacterium]
MPGDPNKLSRFWQELKRRKLLRVITVYAAVAFVILQLVEILAPSLRLPEWTMNFILVILIVGFIITVIVSWIYDIHPEGGIVKTEPSKKVIEDSIPPSSKGWKIASYISFVVIVALIVLNVIPRTKRVLEKEILDKSIAVLPFINDSEDIGNEHIINGIMEEILINLQSIKELRVPARTSVEQYRNNPKPVPEIASELNVAYIVEGSGQRYGKKIRLRVQLVEGATDKHIWADSYDEEINEPEDIFRIQSQIAESIAAELEAIITPEEKLLIEKIPTTNLTAHDFYQRGKEEHWKYWSDNDNIEALERAEVLYHDALEYDPAFAKAYSGLARVYWDKHYWETYFSGNFLDSVLILADVALSFDDQLAEAYTIRGDYFNEKGFTEQSIKEYDKAIKFNPNDWKAYNGKGILYLFSIGDHVRAIDNFQKAVNLNRGSELPFLLGSLGMAYRSIGFIEISKDYNHEALKLSGDSIEYYRNLSYEEIITGNYMKAIEYAEKLDKIDSNDVLNLSILGFIYVFLGQHEEALELYKRYIEIAEIGQGFSLFDMHRIGWAYWQNGYKEEAEYYFKEQIDYCNRMNELGRESSETLRTFYDLAAVYAFMGEKEKAYENLRIHNQRQQYSLGHFTRIKNDPLFENIRDEPEFQQILHDVEAKFQAEHERVR